MIPIKIISGGQTGADQAGLHAARFLRIETGGYAPKYFTTEQGPCPDLGSVFGLKDCNGDYGSRTRLNIENSDGTVIFSTNKNSPGTRLTIKICKALGKPYILNPEDGNALFMFCTLNNIRVLNVGGNRLSKSPNIYAHAFEVIVEAFSEGEE